MGQKIDLHTVNVAGILTLQNTNMKKKRDLFSINVIISNCKQNVFGENIF